MLWRRPGHALMIDAALLPIAKAPIIAFIIALASPDAIDAIRMILITRLAERRIDKTVSASALFAFFIAAEHPRPARLAFVARVSAEIAGIV